MIDAAWVGSADSNGDTAESDYTTVVWEYGAGLGATITPAGGDTGKTLFVPNAGERNANGTYNYGGQSRLWLDTLYSATHAWFLTFSGTYPSGRINADLILDAYPLRCVRS